MFYNNEISTSTKTTKKYRMKGNELRIGNLILDSNYTEKKLYKIIEVSIPVLENITDSNYSFQPIPLTEEWLIKFGFKKKGGRFCKDYYEINVNGIFNPTDAYYTIHNNIKYVHQLQNLYFALTGDELK